MRKTAASIVPTLTAALLVVGLLSVAMAATPEMTSVGSPFPEEWNSTDLSLAINIPLSGDSNENAVALYRLRPEGGALYPDEWEVLTISPGGAAAEAGGLVGGNLYRIQIRVTDSDGIADAPPEAEVVGGQAMLEFDARTPRNMTYTEGGDAEVGPVGSTNTLAIRWPMGGDEDGDASARYRLRVASEASWSDAPLFRSPASFEATATGLLPGIDYVAELIVADPDGLNGSIEITEYTSSTTTFTVSTQPVLLEEPTFSPKPTGTTVWLPFSSDSDNDSSADLLLSADGGETWTRHAMTRDGTARRFAASVAGLAPDAAYLAAFEAADPDGTAGVGPEDRFPFRTLEPWALVPRGTVLINGEPEEAPLAPTHYWWRSPQAGMRPLPLTVLPNNTAGILDLDGTWRVRPRTYTSSRGVTSAFSPANADLEVAGGSPGSPDGEGWYGPFPATAGLSLNLREAGEYAYDLELTATGHYLDGEAFTLPVLSQSYTASTIFPNSSRRTP